MSHYNCLHPLTVTNPYGEIISVPCGECEACTNRKSYNYVTQCKLESLGHKYCMFVTLTYADPYLPLVSVKYHQSFVYFNPVGRLHEHYIKTGRPFFAVAHVSQFSTRSLSLYKSKFHLPEHIADYIPVLDKVDLQLFMKRLRYYLSKYTDEKIRYFASGEYGPVHFRPHYHLLLWFDQQETFTCLRHCILKAWQYGRVDASLSRGAASSYTSAYTNSISSRSRLHAVKYLRPFCLHSSYLFGSFYKDEETQILETTFDQLSRKTFIDCGRFKQVPPLLAFENKFYRRCVNFNSLNHRQRMECYRIYSTAVKEYGALPISKLSVLVWQDENSYTHRLFASFTYTHKFMQSTIESSLYLSKRFIELCHTLNVSYEYYLKILEQYWIDKDYNALKNQLSDQEEYVNQYGKEFLPYLLSYYGVEPLGSSEDERIKEYPKPVLDYLYSIGVEPQFFTSDLFPKDKDKSFQNYNLLHKKLSSDLVKHKKLNDSNKFFLNN